MTRFEDVGGRLVARADEVCPICHPKVPRTDVSPPSRRSVVEPPWAGVSPPSRPSTEHSPRSGEWGPRRSDHPHPFLLVTPPEQPDESIDWAKVAVLATLSVFAWAGVVLLVRHVWLAVS